MSLTSENPLGARKKNSISKSIDVKLLFFLPGETFIKQASFALAMESMLAKRILVDLLFVVSKMTNTT